MNMEGDGNYRNPIDLFKDSAFQTHVLYLFFVLIVAALLGLLYSGVFSYPAIAGFVSSRASRRRLRRYAKIAGMSVGETTTAGPQTPTTIEVDKVCRVKTGGGVGAGAGARAAADEAEARATADEAAAAAAAAATAAAIGAIASLLESDADDAGEDVGAARPSPSWAPRKLSLSERRGAFLEFLASAEFHQAEQGQEEGPLCARSTDVEAAAGSVVGSHRGSSASPVTASENRPRPPQIV